MFRGTALPLILLTSVLCYRQHIVTSQRQSHSFLGCALAYLILIWVLWAILCLSCPLLLSVMSQPWIQWLYPRLTWVLPCSSLVWPSVCTVSLFVLHFVLQCENYPLCDRAFALLIGRTNGYSILTATLSTCSSSVSFITSTMPAFAGGTGCVSIIKDICTPRVGLL